MSTTVSTTSANLYSNPSNDAAKSAKPADASVANQAAATDSVSSATPTSAKDGVALSSETGSAEKPNPYAGISEQSSSVTVDGWKKGKNDSLEGILRNQGYSLKDIYTKDKDGKTLVDRVAEANGLKNPNVIHPGQNLQVPTREKSESLSSKDLHPGEEQTSQVDISEESSDGAVENFGRRVHEYIFGAPDKPEAASVEGASDVQVTRDAEGRATVTVTVNGEKKEIVQTEGDTDDSLLERAGEVVDNTIAGAGRAIGGAWDTVTGWFGGGDEAETEKSEVRKSN